MVVLLCVLSRTFKKAYVYARIAAYVVFVVQVTIQIMLGSTFEESVCIWLCELFIALITAKRIKEEVVVQEEVKEEKVEDEMPEEAASDTKEETP